MLTDFGIAAPVDATQHFTGMARTVKYGAPETLSGMLDRAADWWSLGMILVELLTGRHPFDGLSDAVITHRLMTAGIDLSGVTDPDRNKLCRGLLLRTLRHAEPIVLRIQGRLDAWAHAARINALFRNRNLAQGAGGFFGILFMFAAQVLSRFLIWLIIIPAAIFGWRMWGIVELRNAIRELGQSLPARVPQS